MKRVDFMLDDGNYNKLKGLKGNMSDHIRYALETYLDTYFSTSISESGKRSNNANTKTQEKNS